MRRSATVREPEQAPTRRTAPSVRRWSSLLVALVITLPVTLSATAAAAAPRSGPVEPAQGDTSGGTSVTIQTPASLRFSSIVAAPEFTVALDSNGDAWGWGTNRGGVLGDGPGSFAPAHLDMPPGVSFTSLAAGLDHVIALDTDGSAWNWGNINSGANDPDSNMQRIPSRVPMPGGVTFVAVDASLDRSVALASDGSVWAWGANNVGQIGDGTTVNRSAPTRAQLPDGVTISQVAAGPLRTLALASDGGLWAWGNNFFGEFGDGNEMPTPTLLQTPPGVTFAAVDAGAAHSIALTSDGSVWAWGSNENGELGDGTHASRSDLSPVMTPAGPTFTAISAGWSSNMALASDGSAWAWGSNHSGNLGDGTQNERSTPVQVQVPPDVTFTAIDAEDTHSAAVASDGSAWAWGANRAGELGTGEKDGSHLVPVRSDPVTEVRFAEAASPSQELRPTLDGRSIAAITPPHPAGPVDVEIVRASGSVVLPAAYTYTGTPGPVQLEPVVPEPVVPGPALPGVDTPTDITLGGPPAGAQSARLVATGASPSPALALGGGLLMLGLALMTTPLRGRRMRRSCAMGEL